jgi:hypothetical protein
MGLFSLTTAMPLYCIQQLIASNNFKRWWVSHFQIESSGSPHIPYPSRAVISGSVWQFLLVPRGRLNMFLYLRPVMPLSLALFFSCAAFAQQALYSAAAASSGYMQVAPAAIGGGIRPFSKVAIGATVSPLGIGVGAATSITRSINLRAGWNVFSYSLTGSTDGANYSGKLNLHSFQASADWFPWWHKSFHISPGLLFNNQNRVRATGGVSGGESFTLNSVNYYSDPADPVSGSGSVTFRTAAPMLTVGWGNWIPRRERKHFSFPFDIGFAYTGDPSIKLNLAGSVCQNPGGINCSTIATDPSVQANIQGQIRKLQNDLDLVRFYPIVSGGVVYKF